MSGSEFDLPADFEDLLVALFDADVEFVLVGGYAVALHGHPRSTKDIDVFVRPNPENARRVMEGLAAFGAPLAAFQISEADFSEPGQVLQMGVPPYRIDLLTQATGISFDEATADSQVLSIDGRAIRVIGREALLKNKRATARPQDLADVAALESLEQDS